MHSCTSANLADSLEDLLRILIFTLEVCGVCFFLIPLHDLSHMVSAMCVFAKYVFGKFLLLERSHSEYRVV